MPVRLSNERSGAVSTALRPTTRFSSIPHETREPVGLPGAPPVGRERLLELEGALRNLGKDEAHEDGVAAGRFLIVELAPAVAEPADHRRADQAVAGVRPVDAPLVSGRVIESHRKTADLSRGARE